MGAFDRLTVPQIASLFLLGMRRVDRNLPEAAMQAQARDRRRRPQRTYLGLLRSDGELREAAAVDAWVKFHDADELAVREGTLSIAAAEDEGGKIQRFLQWIIDHKEEIFAFIEMIIGLFSGMPVAAVASESLAAQGMVGACGNRGPPPIDAAPIYAEAIWHSPVDVVQLAGIAESVELFRYAADSLLCRLKAGIESVKSAA
jgi:hypothetical protein